MHRQTVYPGQILPETTLLNMTKDSMIGMAKLAAAVLGTSTMVNGLACGPTAPASMQVAVAAGEIYSLQNVDGTAFSSLAADTTHQILKQGLSMDAVTLSCPSPATAGQSINYLVQATYQDVDANPTVLPYYNASNPAQAYSGPANSGTSQATVRQGLCQVAVKVGVAATSGTQVTPAPDPGYIGLYVVTVANGASTITGANISTYSGAPFLTENLTQKISQTTGDARYATQVGFQQNAYSVANAGGTADAITGTYSPVVTALTNGMTLNVRTSSANATTTPTFTPASGTIAAKTIVKGAGAALVAGDIAGGGHWIELQYDLTLDKWVLLNPAMGVSVASLPEVPVRQTVLGAPVDTSGLPSFLPATSASLSITSQNIAAGAPLVIAAANGFNSTGALDRIGISTSNLTWSGLSANTTNYLYVDVAANGTLTPGSTTLAPIYQQGGTQAVTANQATFNIAQMQMFVGNGSTAPQTYRVFVGEVVTGASTVTSTVAYSLAARYETGRFSIATGTAYSKNHNLGVEPHRIRVFGSETTGGVLAEPIMYYYSDGGHYLGVRNVGRLGLILQTGSYQAQVVNSVGTVNAAVEALVIVERGW
jgi:Na+-translocating ferredoxin:NAD+ oxidoreductase RnfG subunit